MVVFNFQIYNITFNLFIFSFLIFLFPFTNLSVEKFELTFIYFLFLGFLLFLVNNNIEGLKFARTIISILVVRFIFYKILYKYNYWKILFFVLFTHTIIVVVSFFYPTLVDIIGPYFGFEKVIKSIRFPGLTSGYDISGMVILSSIVILDSRKDVLLKNNSSIQYFFLYIISFFALLLTSRFTILFYMFYFLYKILQDKIYIYFLGIIILLVILLVPSFNELIEGIMMTLNFIDVSQSNSYYEFLIHNYSQTNNVDDIKSAHYSLHYNNYFELLFGFVKQEYRSDVGFVNYINFYGVFNLLLLLLIYFKYSYNVFKINSPLFQKQLFYILFILFFMGTFKNNYIFSRTSFEIFYLVYLFVKQDCLNNTKEQVI